MKITYDKSVDAAYIKLSEKRDHGFTYCCDVHEVGGMINLDFDSDGALYGIELLSGKKFLGKDLMNLAIINDLSPNNQSQ